MTELILFTSTFILVFALGLQSLNVNNGHFVLAAITSFVIGCLFNHLEAYFIIMRL
jgi:hypothetical protein